MNAGMQGGPAAVVVKRGGFFTAIASGVFGLLITGVVCASGLAAYGLYIVDNRVGNAFDIGSTIVQSLPDWSERLPNVIADALNDRRAAEYRESLNVAVKFSPRESKRGERLAILEVENRGTETVTLLAMNLLLIDAEGNPIGESRAYAATPFSIDEGQWRGPILPGSTRRTICRIWADRDATDVTVEISELRVANSEPAPEGGESLAATARMSP